MSQKGKVKLSLYIFILAVSKRSWGIQLPSVDTIAKPPQKTSFDKHDFFLLFKIHT